MPTVNDVRLFLDKMAPISVKMDFDNVGFLVGFSKNEVSRIIVALDITDEVIGEAIDKGAELIVSHHPMFFNLKNVTDCDGAGRKIVKLLNNGISAICLHTNLDAAVGGVNDRLAEVLGLKVTGLLDIEGKGPGGEDYSFGRVAELRESVSLKEFLPTVKTVLNTTLRYHDAGRPVKRVALVGGSGGNYLSQVLSQKCDTFITADIKYDVFLTAKEEGINLIDGDHFCTENVVCEVLKSWLSSEFGNISIEVSSRHAQTAKFF